MNIQTLRGRVAKGDHLAVTTWAKVAPVIAAKFDLRNLHPGTFNVELGYEYCFSYDVLVHPWQFDDKGSYFKCKRCRIGGVRCAIARPLDHEHAGHERLTCLEILSEYNLRDYLRVATGAPVFVEVGGNDEWWNADSSLRELAAR